MGVRSTLFLLLLATNSAFAAGLPCPTNIQYKNGNYLKRGDNFYYQNGTYLARGGHLYYPDGNYLRRDSNVYYPGGVYLMKGQDLYYPNGGYLKRGANYYYANGSYFKRDSNFYYSSGNYARHNGKLYRPDGSTTPFPITLTAPIDKYGALLAEVQTDHDLVELDFQDLLVESDGARLAALWNGQEFSQFQILLNTGEPNENVFVWATGAQISCSLGTGGQVPAPFTLHSPGATLQVKVHPGYDAAKVRQALQTALDALTPLP